jgi:hypothetical protein
MFIWQYNSINWKIQSLKTIMTRINRIIYKESQCTYLCTWLSGPRCPFKFLHCLPPHLQSFSAFTLSSLHMVNSFSDSPATLQHADHPHFASVLLWSINPFLLSAGLHVHTPLYRCPAIRHTRITTDWPLVLAQRLISISAFLEPSVSAWFLRQQYGRDCLSLVCSGMLWPLATRSRRSGRTVGNQAPLLSRYKTIIISVIISCHSCFPTIISCA